MQTVDFFFNLRYFFNCIRFFERWPIFGGKIRCVFYPAAKKTEIQGMRKNQHRLKCSLHLGGALCVDVPPNTKTLCHSLTQNPPQMKGSDVHKQIIM